MLNFINELYINCKEVIEILNKNTQMEKQIYLVTYALETISYMNKITKEHNKHRLVFAETETQAIEKLIKYYENKSEEYYKSYIVNNVSAIESIV